MPTLSYNIAVLNSTQKSSIVLSETVNLINFFPRHWQWGKISYSFIPGVNVIRLFTAVIYKCMQ